MARFTSLFEGEAASEVAPHGEDEVGARDSESTGTTTLFVILVEAKHLQCLTGLAGSVSPHAYGVVRLRDQRQTTHVVDSNADPVWNEAFEFPMGSRMGEYFAQDKHARGPGPEAEGNRDLGTEADPGSGSSETDGPALPDSPTLEICILDSNPLIPDESLGDVEVPLGAIMGKMARKAKGCVLRTDLRSLL